MYLSFSWGASSATSIGVKWFFWCSWSISFADALDPRSPNFFRTFCRIYCWPKLALSDIVLLLMWLITRAIKYPYRNLWIAVPPVGLYPPYFYVHLFRHVGELRACAIWRAQSLRLGKRYILIYDTSTMIPEGWWWDMNFVEVSYIKMYLFSRRSNWARQIAHARNSPTWRNKCT